LDWKDSALETPVWTPAIPQRIDVILFDLDGTLRFNRPSSIDVFLHNAAALGVSVPPGKRAAAIRWTHRYWAQSAELLQDSAAFPEDENGFWTHYAYRMLLHLGCEDAFAVELAPVMHQKMSTEHNPVNWIPDEVPETLSALRQAGLRLGLLTNRDKPVNEELAQWGLSDYFDMALTAGEVSAWKPDPLIFRHALERMAADPAASLYVGDNYYADIVGAQRAGMRAVLLDPEGIFPNPGCPVIETLSDLMVLV
jgi:putative hydrolase of the HAD superfamily